MVFNVSDTNKTYRVYMTDSQFDNFKVNGLIPKDVNDIDNYLKSTYIMLVFLMKYNFWILFLVCFL